MNNMFKPKGELPLWKMIYNHISELPTETVIRYDDLSEIVGQDIKLARSSVYRASKEMLKTQKRMLVIVRDVGYKIVEGMEIMQHAEGRHDIANRQVVLAGFETKNIDTVKLTPDEKTKLHDFMLYNANIKMAFVNTIGQLEKASQLTQITQQFTDSQIAKLKELVNN